jgi:bla regulator protein blaR1
MSIVESISHPVISALSWSVMHAIWQFTVIMGLYYIAIKLSARSRAAVRHNMALLALVAMPVTFLITFLRQYNVYRNARMIVSLEFNDLSWAASAGETPIYILNKEIPLLLDRIEPYIPFIFWFYVIGLVFFSLNGLFGYIRLNSMRRRYIQPMPQDWIIKLRQFAKRAGVSGIHTFLSSKVDVPMVAGMIRPVILLPVSMLTTLSPEQAETIILHELRHIRNYDHYINILQNIIEILLFFHPATWYISKQLRAEREKRVDEWVVGESKSPLPYAQALLHLEQNRGHALQPALAATQSKTLLLTRIKNIMTMKTRTFNPGKNLAALLTIVAAVFMLAWYDPALGISYYQMDEPGQHVFYNEPPVNPARMLALATPENADDTPVVNKQEKETLQDKEPKKVYFHDGSSMSWEALSEEDRNEINKAIEEARLAITEVNREVMEQFQSEEFRQQMQQVQEEIRRAMEEVNAEINNHMHSEEFRRDMEQAREEIRRAMEEVNAEINSQMHSEEFRRDMEQAREEIRKAMEEVNAEINNHMHSEEFRRDMEQAREEIRKAMEEVNRELMNEFRSEEFKEEMRKAGEEINEALKEMDQVDWEALGAELNAVMKELGYTLEQIGPIVNESIREIKLDELLNEVMRTIEEAVEPSQETQEKKPEK